MPQPPSPAADEYLVVKVRQGPPPPGVLTEFDAGPKIPAREMDEADLPALLAEFGVNHLAGIAGTEDRTVKLSDQSNIVCPAHGRYLKPDACRSCAFLAGEVHPDQPQPPHPPQPAA